MKTRWSPHNTPYYDAKGSWCTSQLTENTTEAQWEQSAVMQAKAARSSPRVKSSPMQGNLRERLCGSGVFNKRLHFNSIKLGTDRYLEPVRILLRLAVLLAEKAGEYEEVAATICNGKHFVKVQWSITDSLTRILQTELLHGIIMKEVKSMAGGENNEEGMLRVKGYQDCIFNLKTEKTFKFQNCAKPIVTTLYGYWYTSSLYSSRTPTEAYKVFNTSCINISHLHTATFLRSFNCMEDVRELSGATYVTDDVMGWLKSCFFSSSISASLTAVSRCMAELNMT